MRDTPAHVGFDLALGEKRNPGLLPRVGLVPVGLSAGKRKFPMGCGPGTQVRIPTQPLTGWESL